MSVRKIIGSRMSDRLSSNISNTPYDSWAYNLCLHWMNSQAILVPFPKLQHNFNKILSPKFWFSLSQKCKEAVFTYKLCMCLCVLAHDLLMYCNDHLVGASGLNFQFLSFMCRNYLISLLLFYIFAVAIVNLLSQNIWLKYKLIISWKREGCG